MDYLDTKGRIFDIQKYSVHDGPGIRTIVFLKGCVLRCRWCCNPESQEYRIQNMKVLGEDKVIGRDVTVREMIEEVEKDRAYYYRSGGGITLSGGECMCQADFSRDLLRAAKERGINTAIESMACAPWEKIEQVLPYLDVYLMDIKHMNQEKHKEFTGRANGLMLENARKVALYGKTRLVIRVPVIPTFNDSVEEIQAIARFAASLPGVNKIHLLPYHRLGQDKYEGLGRPYLMEGILPPTADVKERGACGMRSGLSDWRLRNTGLKRKDPLQTCNIKNNKNNIINNKKPTQNNGLPLTYFVVWSKMFSETK